MFDRTRRMLHKRRDRKEERKEGKGLFSKSSPKINVGGYIHTGDLMMHNKKYEEAYHYYKEAVRMSPDNFDAVQKLLLVCNVTGRTEEELEVAARLDELSERRVAGVQNNDSEHILGEARRRAGGF